MNGDRRAPVADPRRVALAQMEVWTASRPGFWGAAIVAKRIHEHGRNYGRREG